MQYTADEILSLGYRSAVPARIAAESRSYSAHFCNDWVIIKPAVSRTIDIPQLSIHNKHHRRALTVLLLAYRPPPLAALRATGSDRAMAAPSSAN
jgi:hypothetical protein